MNRKDACDILHKVWGLVEYPPGKRQEIKALFSALSDYLSVENPEKVQMPVTDYIWVDQAPVAIAPAGLREIDGVYCSRIKSITTGYEAIDLAIDILNNKHLHPEIKHNLIVNLRQRVKELA